MAQAAKKRATGSKKASSSPTTRAAGSSPTKKRGSVTVALTQLRKKKKKYCEGSGTAAEVRTAARKYVALKVAKLGKDATPAVIKKTKSAAKKTANSVLTGKCKVKTVKTVTTTKKRRKTPAGIKGLS